MEKEAEDVGDGDWERATDESLEKAVSDASDAFKHATSYVIGEQNRHAKCQERPKLKQYSG